MTHHSAMETPVHLRQQGESFVAELPPGLTYTPISILDTPQNQASFEATVASPWTWARPMRPHLTVAADDGELCFVRDGGNDMGGPSGHKRLHGFSLGRHVLFAMYYGSSGYGGNYDSGRTMRVPYQPKAGELVLAGRMNDREQMDDEAERLIASWGGPTCRLLYAVQAVRGGVRLIDPVTDEGVIPDADYPPPGIGVKVLVAILSKPKPPTAIVRP